MKKCLLIPVVILILTLVPACMRNTSEQIPEPDKPSMHAAEKTRGLYLSPGTDYLVESAGTGLSVYTIGNQVPRPIWSCSEPDYWGSSFINWSSNGQKFIFTSTSYPDDNWNNMQMDIWLVDMHRQNPVKILKNKACQIGQWSPDGRYILFLYTQEERNIKRIYREASTLLLYDTKTAQSRLLMSGSDKQHIVHPIWSPDSQCIIYNALLEDDSFILAVYDLRKEISEQIATTKTPYFPQTWSQDGSKVFYETGSYGGVDSGLHQIGFYDLDHRQHHPLTSEAKYGPSNRLVSISPDEQTLLFSKDQQGLTAELWQMNIESGISHRVHTGDRISKALWTQDSQNYLYYIRENKKDSNLGRIMQHKVDQTNSTELQEGAVGLEHIYKGELYYMEESQSGSLKEYTLQAMNLANGNVRAILSIPEYTHSQD